MVLRLPFKKSPLTSVVPMWLVFSGRTRVVLYSWLTKAKACLRAARTSNSGNCGLKASARSASESKSHTLVMFELVPAKNGELILNWLNHLLMSWSNEGREDLAAVFPHCFWT